MEDVHIQRRRGEPGLDRLPESSSGPAFHKIFKVGRDPAMTEQYASKRESSTPWKESEPPLFVIPIRHVAALEGHEARAARSVPRTTPLHDLFYRYGCSALGPGIGERTRLRLDPHGPP